GSQNDRAQVSLQVKVIYEGGSSLTVGRSGGTKICFSPCYAEVHNRMLNTRSGAGSANISEILSYSLEPSRVVEHTRYNPSRSRRQPKRPASVPKLRKDPTLCPR